MTLELTEVEADYAVQALQHELEMVELMERHADAFEPEVMAVAAVKIAILRGIIDQLVSS